MNWFSAIIAQSPFNSDKKIILPIMSVHSHYEPGGGYIRDRIEDPLDRFSIDQEVFVISKDDLSWAEWDEFLLKGKKA